MDKPKKFLSGDPEVLPQSVIGSSSTGETYGDYCHVLTGPEPQRSGRGLCYPLGTEPVFPPPHQACRLALDLVPIVVTVLALCESPRSETPLSQEDLQKCTHVGSGDN